MTRLCLLGAVLFVLGSCNTFDAPSKVNGFYDDPGAPDVFGPVSVLPPVPGPTVAGRGGAPAIPGASGAGGSRGATPRGGWQPVASGSGGGTSTDSDAGAADDAGSH